MRGRVRGMRRCVWGGGSSGAMVGSDRMEASSGRDRAPRQRRHGDVGPLPLASGLQHSGVLHMRGCIQASAWWNRSWAQGVRHIPHVTIRCWTLSDPLRRETVFAEISRNTSTHHSYSVLNWQRPVPHLKRLTKFHHCCVTIGCVCLCAHTYHPLPYHRCCACARAAVEAGGWTRTAA